MVVPENQEMRVVSLNIGRPQIVMCGGQQYSTAINRRSVDGPLEATPLGFVGDRVSNEKVHGGPDKAVCCYPHEHYAHWSPILGRELEVPSFGENLTTQGMLESDVCIGDVFRVGGAEMQVSQPRLPCSKLAGKLSEQRIIKWILENQFSGFYFRVLKPGAVQAGDPVERISHPHPDLSIARMVQLKSQPAPDPGLCGRLAALSDLSESWREHFRQPDRRPA